MSAAQWFYVDRAGLQQGPVLPTFFQDALRRGDLQMETLVWRDGLSQWVPLQQAAVELGFYGTPSSPAGPPAAGSTAQPHVAAYAQPSSIAVPAADYGIVLLAIPAVATLLIWFWVASMNLLQNPGSSMTLIMLGTVLGTAIVAAMEASKNGMKSVRSEGTYSPTSWFFIFLLLWIIGYPMYLYKRKKYGLKNLLVLGLIAAIVFVVSYSIMSTAIDEKIAEIQRNLGQ